MRKLAVILSLLGLVALGGCVQFTTDLVLEKDGSGTMTMNFSMSQEMIDAVESMKDMPGAGQQSGPSPEMMDKGEIEKYAAHYGVKVKDYEDSVVEGRKNTKVVLAFDDYNDLACMMTSMSSDSEESLVLHKLADGNYSLGNGTPECPEPLPEEKKEPETSTTEEQAQPDPAAAGKAMEAMGKMMSAMSELKIVMKITVPGDVVETNAHQTEGHTVIWTIDSSNMMAMQGGFDPEVTFVGKGLKLKAQSE